MTTLLVAHGTRNPHGVKMIGDLAAAMARTLDDTVRVAFVDVLSPAPDEVLRTMRDEPIVLVPALLSSGHHVRRDVPR
jgi:sirohydrochlorin ferrochelatase